MIELVPKLEKIELYDIVDKLEDFIEKYATIKNEIIKQTSNLS